ncbi:hypothetical protein MNEG_1353 [Monoraphidium neglectum]|jgi:hypothetical protein|uniref:Uncharacterized protein n=1 Tax=Monoraphidium neglectum TaxID=145388 RepID=A0A0D2MVR7_9CHLO|nr:hypothetical protein MNEG_1353 [Monoraphidium neglectum]KIZ06600.1 hypothetical protein MNEG_1353 [Monoraphidium neglectum]|eukprot:XP_013905619.1 hypothetical protein MNEG_1353 [Monoraphidium neglectum]
MIRVQHDPYSLGLQRRREHLCVRANAAGPPGKGLPQRGKVAHGQKSAAADRQPAGAGSSPAAARAVAWDGTLGLAPRLPRPPPAQPSSEPHDDLAEGPAAAALGAAVVTPARQLQADGPNLDDPAPAPLLPGPVLFQFQKQLTADVSSVGLTLAAVTGVIVYWRGVWSLLDYCLGDSVLGAACCVAAGLTMVMWIRLSGAKVATSFWPPG